FDSHTLPPHPPHRTASPDGTWGRTARRHVHCALAVAVVAVLAVPLRAQDTLPAPPPPAQDTAVFPRPPVTPIGALLRSFVLPGWSQALLGRRLTGGLFMAWEGVTLGMTIKATRELRHLKQGQDSVAIENKKQEREDWLALLLFNHLFAGLEGFVAAHLWDFPEDVRIRAAPAEVGLRVSFPIRFR
ncbi:MAG: hypothetical protein ACREN5_02305, partial [Gemmatimonadales bacterium]